MRIFYREKGPLSELQGPRAPCFQVSSINKDDETATWQPGKSSPGRTPPRPVCTPSTATSSETHGSVVCKSPKLTFSCAHQPLKRGANGDPLKHLSQRAQN